MPPVIAYLVNQYPQPSQSFVRREIAALEAMGVEVRRFTLRRFGGTLKDPADVAERERTTAILGLGKGRLLRDLIGTAVGRPSLFVKALREAWRAGRLSPRGRLIALIYLTEACSLLRLLDGVEHVHAHFGTNSAEVAKLCRLLGGPPYSFTCHGPEEFDNPVGLDLAGKVRYAKFAVAVSSFGRSQLWRWADFGDWDKIRVVHCGVDKSFLDNEPTPVPDSADFVCVGRLAEQKGQMVLVRAAKILRDAGETFTFHLLGDGPLRPALEAAIGRDGLRDHVVLHGLASGEEVRRHMLAARATLLPSFAEGLPVVLMESLALGRPAVTTSVAGIPELVDDTTGWVVPAGDAEAFAEAVRKALAASADELSERGRAGAERVRERHDARREAERLLGHVRRGR